MYLKSVSKNCFLLVVVLVLSACNADKYAVGDVEGALHKNPVQNKYPGKPHAPVYLKYAVPKNIAVGDNLEIDLQFRSDIDADALHVKVNLQEDGLLVLNSMNQYAFGIQSKGQNNPLALSLQANANGLFYVHLTATLDNQGKTQSRSFSIPVKVGNVDMQKQLKHSGQLGKDSKGRPIIIMPAETPQ